MASTAAAAPQQTAAESGEAAVNILFSISQILDTGLDKETLRVLIGLVESGVNPEALALVVKELRREAGVVSGESAAAAGGAHSPQQQ